MKKFIVSAVVAFLVSGQFAGDSYAGVPLNNLEGVGGIAFNPLAYLANAGSKWKKKEAAVSADQTAQGKKGAFDDISLLSDISKPQAGAWYVRLPESHVDWTALGTAASAFDRVEVSYGWEAVAPQGGRTIYKNNVGTKLLLVNENAGGHKFLPAVSVGGILKNTNTVPSGTNHVGFDTYLVATKLIKETPLPVLFSGGVLATNSRTTGVFGYDHDYRLTWFGNADLIVLKNLAVGYEYKQGAKFHGWHDADYQDIHAAWFLNDRLSLVGAWVYAGKAKSTREVGLGDGFTVSLHYAL
ncbi:MAG TPA: DUF3034 family protein [Candidatus Omnitrophota bacterium]|nr:DUF3034 family protein [Candidatus Omnitrophota bacterium]HPS36370.1 DUF3034 family protein [Candidatus Omnitrophota bacterium]